jgi:hypothetical protein
MSSSIEILIDALKEVVLTEQQLKILAPLFEHVKEMHKQEIITTYLLDCLDVHKIYAEQYYQETFKKVI